MVDRILELLKEKKLSPSQFADEVGIQRSGMSHLLSGRNKPSLELILKILRRFPDIKADWLLYGTVAPELELPLKQMELIMPTEQTLFDVPEISESKQDLKPLRTPAKVKSTEKRIDKIVIFYEDRSFREYEPDR